MEKIQLKTQKDLRRHAKLIVTRINENPSLSTLCIANPVLGLRELGFEMSAKLVDHIHQALPLPFVTPDDFEKLKTGQLKLHGISRLSFKRFEKEK